VTHPNVYKAIFGNTKTVPFSRCGIRIPKQCSISSGEARALLLALEHFENGQQKDSIIFTDLNPFKQWAL